MIGIGLSEFIPRLSGEVVFRTEVFIIGNRSENYTTAYDSHFSSGSRRNPQHSNLLIIHRPCKIEPMRFASRKLFRPVHA
jgi:hypothetical protein